eukprot:2061427-Amphidinium_carterae.1
MLVNWSRSKTEVTLSMVPPTGKPLLQGLKNIGNANKIGAPAILLKNGRFLAVAATYMHLGRVFSQDASCSKEVNRMATKASVELELKRAVLCSPSIHRRDRLLLFQRLHPLSSPS